MATNRDMRSTISVQGYTKYRLRNCTLTNVKKRAETARERKVSPSSPYYLYKKTIRNTEQSDFFRAPDKHTWIHL